MSGTGHVATGNPADGAGADYYNAFAQNGVLQKQDQNQKQPQRSQRAQRTSKTATKVP
jgi:hypothetical protein